MSKKKTQQPTSAAKIAANRRNAQRSTGPRGLLGKATSRLNAVRHGLRSSELLMPGESADEFCALREAMFADLVPIGQLESGLVDALLAYGWRLRRAAQCDSGLFAKFLVKASSNNNHRVADPEVQRTLDLGEAVTNMALCPGDALSKLHRYEAGLERAYWRTLHELQRLQAARAGEDVAPPAVVDVAVHLDARPDEVEATERAASHGCRPSFPEMADQPRDGRGERVSDGVNPAAATVAQAPSDPCETTERTQGPSGQDPGEVATNCP
jgi:hypothetical protein